MNGLLAEGRLTGHFLQSVSASLRLSRVYLLSEDRGQVPLPGLGTGEVRIKKFEICHFKLLATGRNLSIYNSGPGWVGYEVIMMPDENLLARPVFCRWSFRSSTFMR